MAIDPSGPQPSPQGYGDERYVRSLEEWGESLALEGAGGWLLARHIPETSGRDALGPYPMLACSDWSRLCDDLAVLPDDLVSVTFVADPFGDIELAQLKACLDVVRSFKQRYVTDLSVPLEQRVSRRHRRQVTKSLKDVEVELVRRPLDYLDEWIALFSNTVRRHDVTGMRAFSRRAFELQLAIPGVVMFRAVHDGDTVAINLWCQRGDVAYGHLAGIADTGYRLSASYALYWEAVRWFAGRCAWLDLGGAAGTGGSEDAGLDYLKQGWATEARPSYLCGRILDKDRYQHLARMNGASDDDYFPAYRRGEFG